MSGQLEYYFDYASPYSYLANSQIPGLAERTGATILYRPVLLGAIIVDSKNTPPPSVPEIFRLELLTRFHPLTNTVMSFRGRL